MNIAKDIPAQKGVVHEIERITFNLTSKKAYVEVRTTETPHKTVEVDIIKLFTDYTSTTTQKNTIRAFFRYVMAEAIEIAENQITETIFSES